MSLLYNKLLINDIKALSYSYDPEKGCWRAERFRGNRVKKFGTIIKVKITKKGKIKASVKQLEAPPRSRSRNDYTVVDISKVKFKDKEFIDTLKSLKTH